MAVKPNSYDPNVATSNFELKEKILEENVVALKRNVQQLMSHDDYITRILASTCF